MSPWVKAGVLDRVFEELQVSSPIMVEIEAVSLGSSSVKVYPDGTGALKKRGLAQSLGFEPVVPRQQTRVDPWDYDTELHEKRNEIERLFGLIERFRRVFTRYDKTDIMFSAFMTLAQIADLLRQCGHALPCRYV